MATEKRESFPTTEDAADGSGVPLSSKTEGDPSASDGTNYHGALVGKDPSGNLQFIALNDNREVIVDNDSAEVACVSAEGEIEDGSGTLAALATITLQASKVYRDLEVWVSCFRDTKYIVEAVDDAGVTDVITQLGIIRTGSGQYTFHGKLDCRQFTSGSTGVQELRIRALNSNALSDISGSIAAIEEQ